MILLDDLGYVQQSPDEAEVLFTLLAERYERRSVMVTSNLVFSQWDRIFRDQMATAAAIDRLVHHAVVLEFDVPSYRTDRSPPQVATASHAPRSFAGSPVAAGPPSCGLLSPQPETDRAWRSTCRRTQSPSAPSPSSARCCATSLWTARAPSTGSSGHHHTLDTGPGRT